MPVTFSRKHVIIIVLVAIVIAVRMQASLKKLPGGPTIFGT